MVFYPSQSLRVGDHRRVARGNQVKNRVFETRRRRGVRGFQQEILRSIECRHLPAAQAFQQARYQMHIGARHQLERNPVRIKRGLQIGDMLVNAGAVVHVHARVNVGRTGHGVDAVGHRQTGHLQ